MPRFVRGENRDYSWLDDTQVGSTINRSRIINRQINTNQNIHIEYVDVDYLLNTGMYCLRSDSAHFKVRKVVTSRFLAPA